MSLLNLVIFDNLDNEKEKKVINKPKTYLELVKYLSSNNKPYELFIMDRDYNKLIINEENKYKLIKNIIFIKEINNVEESLYSKNYINYQNQNKKY